MGIVRQMRNRRDDRCSGEGSAKGDFKQFPTVVQKDMGVALFVVQLGGSPPSAKSWRGLDRK
jgi:hypothetical protein